MFKKLLLTLVLGVGLFVVAASQYQNPIAAQGNPTCPTRPPTDNSNACASTAFVHTAVSGILNSLCTLSPNICVAVFGYANIVWFGAVADSGTTDNGPFLRATYDAAALAAAPVYISPSSNYYGVTTCRNNAVFDGSGVNGNKAVSIYGGGWNLKPFVAPTGSWILPNSTFPATCSFFRGSGTDINTGRVFKNFGLGEFGGSLGVPKGLHAIFIDASNPAYAEISMVIDHVYLPNMAVGKSIFIQTGSPATPGGVPELLLTNSQFKNFEADYLADHVSIVYNSVGQNTTNDARNVGFLFARCNGCTTTTISYNNISSTSGTIIADDTVGLTAENNEIEQPPFTNLNGKQIWLRGTGGTVVNARLAGNKHSTENAVNTVSPVTVDSAQDAQIAGGWIDLPSASILPHVTIGASASGTTVRDISCYLGGVHTFSCNVLNSGAYTGALDWLSISLAGVVDGKTGKLIAPSNANGLTWTLGSVSGTLAGTASTPIVLNSTTGNITCPTCATTGGANIPSVAIGDILYASAANTLSALADVATGNALISGGVGAIPAWGKIGIATHVSGLGSNVATFLGTPSSANLLAALTTSTGTGNAVFSFGPTFTGTITASAAVFSGLVTLPSPIINGLPTGTGVATANTASTLVARDGSGNFAAGTITAALSGNASTATSATSATNGATVATSTNASFFPLFAASSTNSNQPFNLDTTFTYNPSTDTVTATNFAGNASTASTATSATTATNATNTAITDDTTTNATMFLTWVTANTGNLPQKVSSTKYTVNPSTGALTATSFSGAGTGLTGTGASFTAGNVTTNANLTGPITSTGNTTAVALQTGLGSTFAMQNTPTFSNQLNIGNTTTPTFQFIPSSGATKNGQFYQSGDTFGLASQGVGDAMDINLNTLQAAFPAGIASTSKTTGTIKVTGGAGISGAIFTDTLSVITMASDTAQTDNSVCINSAGLTLKGTGTLGICLGTSSARFKQDIVSMGAGLAEIVKLTPKNFFYKKGFGDDNKRLQYGLIAEEVVKVLPGITSSDREGKPQTVDLLALVPVMVNAIKTLKATNDNLESRLVKLEARK